ncbi:hypothetical protein [Dactylosporangium sp. NPDC005555]|uniref:hypothetical protein n=1 Tax=Dactylosporangium sp. NPDC005555 TaxID=3154889 RepID=UPI0033B82D02
MTRLPTRGLARRLTETADDMPAARVPADLWRRGRRRHRTRQVLVTAFVALAAAVPLTALPDPAVLPAAGNAAVPGRLHQPWPWQASVEGDPRGPAALLVSGGGGYQSMDLPFTYGSRISVIGRDGSYRVLPYGNTYLQAGQDVLLSADGRRVAGDGTYLSHLGTGTGDVSVVDLGTGGERRYPGTGNIDPVAWSPDGTRLLIRRYSGPAWWSGAYDGSDTVESDNGALWLLDLGSGATTRLLDLGRTRPGRAAFSPDGRTVAVQAGRDLTLLDTTGGGRRVLTTLPAGAMLGGPWAWSTDGIGVFTIAEGCTTTCTNAERNDRTWRLTVLSSDSGAPTGRTFATFGGAAARLAGWQRDGTAVVVRYLDEADQQGPAYDAPDAYRAVSDVDLLALDPRGGTKVLLRKPPGVIWDLDVAADLVAAGAFGGPSPSPPVLPLARWAATTAFVALWLLGLAVWLVVALVRRSRGPRRTRPVSTTRIRP